MSVSSKDSAEVMEFMTLFARLKQWCDDAPDELAEFAETDASVRKLCLSVFFAARSLSMSERRHKVLFAAPVDPAFVKAWRDYEQRYEPVIWAATLGIYDASVESDNLSRVSEADRQWEKADDLAAAPARGVERAMEFAHFNTDQDPHELPEGLLDWVDEGVAAWERLKRETSFDLHGVFRRQALIPFVLVPRTVAAKHGSAEKLSFLKNLQQSHDAFIFGATFAALALMRSIMEAVLRDHYGADGKDLSERITNARGKLPRGATAAALHRLRKLANAVLHLERERDEGVANMDEARLEKEIVSLLFVLRALIEGAK